MGAMIADLGLRTLKSVDQMDGHMRASAWSIAMAFEDYALVIVRAAVLSRMKGKRTSDFDCVCSTALPFS